MRGMACLLRFVPSCGVPTSTTPDTRLSHLLEGLDVVRVFLSVLSYVPIPAPIGIARRGERPKSSSAVDKDASDLAACSAVQARAPLQAPKREF